MPTFSAFMVADVTMSLRSRLLVRTTPHQHMHDCCRSDSLFRSRPMRMSVLRDRSCASSRMIQLYLSKSPSFNDSLNSTPSVMSVRGQQLSAHASVQDTHT